MWFERSPGTLHRRALLVNSLPSWELGDRVAVRREGLRQGSEWVTLGTARIWRTSPVCLRDVPVAPTARTLLAEAQGALGPVHDVLGLGWQEALAAEARARGAGGVVGWGRRVVGLGPGLTPLGDDLLGGALFALRAVWDGSWRPVEGLVAWAQGRTSRLSACLVSDLSQGHGPEPLHRLGEALSAGRGDAAQAAAWELVGLGHSTGRALLGGALAVWAAVG